MTLSPARVRCSPRISAGIGPAAGSTSAVPAWWSRDDWLAEVEAGLDLDVCRAHHVAPDTVLRVAGGMAYYADHRTGRDCRPTNDNLVELLRISLSSVQRARRVLKVLGYVVELVRGRSIMTYAERIEAWRRGSSHRMVAAVFALCSRRRRAPKTSTTNRGGGTNFPSADLHIVDGDTPPGAGKVSPSPPVRSTRLRRQTENSEEERAPRAAPTKGSTTKSAGGAGTRRLAEAVRWRLGWLAGVQTRRMTPTLSRFARAGWTARDVDLAVRDALAAKGWRVPRELAHPAAYLAGLLRDVDPADRPGAHEEHQAAVERAERAYARRLVWGPPCPHGQPAGHEPSPLRGTLACPSCRHDAAAAAADWPDVAPAGGAS